MLIEIRKVAEAPYGLVAWQCMEDAVISRRKGAARIRGEHGLDRNSLMCMRHRRASCWSQTQPFRMLFDNAGVAINGMSDDCMHSMETAQLTSLSRLLTYRECGVAAPGS